MVTLAWGAECSVVVGYLSVVCWPNVLFLCRHSGAQCITCSYKASSGLLYPLERGFIYVHKPPVHIRFDEISFVNFARGTTTTRSFDFEIETKQGTQYTFSSIERWVNLTKHNNMQVYARTNHLFKPLQEHLTRRKVIPVAILAIHPSIHPFFRFIYCL